MGNDLSFLKERSITFKQLRAEYSNSLSMHLKMALLIFKDLCILRLMRAMRVYGRGSLIMGWTERSRGRTRQPIANTGQNKCRSYLFPACQMKYYNLIN